MENRKERLIRPVEHSGLLLTTVKVDYPYKELCEWAVIIIDTNLLHLISQIKRIMARLDKNFAGIADKISLSNRNCEFINSYESSLSASAKTTLDYIANWTVVGQENTWFVDKHPITEFPEDFKGFHLKDQLLNVSMSGVYFTATLRGMGIKLTTVTIPYTVLGLS